MVGLFVWIFAVLAVMAAILIGVRLRWSSPKGLNVAPVGTPYGVVIVKAICALSLLEILASLVPGVHLPFNVAHRDHATRVGSIVVGFLFGAALYGLQRRLVLTWKVGWVILVAVFSSFLIVTLRSIFETTPGPARWILSTAVVIATMVGVVFGSRFWSSQKQYFSRKGV